MKKPVITLLISLILLVPVASAGGYWENIAKIIATEICLNGVCISSWGEVNTSTSPDGGIPFTDIDNIYLYNNSGTITYNGTYGNQTINASIDSRVTQSFLENLGFNITTDLKTYFDTLYQAAGSYVTNNFLDQNYFNKTNSYNRTNVNLHISSNITALNESVKEWVYNGSLVPCINSSNITCSNGVLAYNGSTGTSGSAGIWTNVTKAEQPLGMATFNGNFNVSDGEIETRTENGVFYVRKYVI